MGQSAAGLDNPYGLCAGVTLISEEVVNKGRKYLGNKEELACRKGC
jgi:hypothetical protein